MCPVDPSRWKLHPEHPTSESPALPLAWVLTTCTGYFPATSASPNVSFVPMVEVGVLETGILGGASPSKAHCPTCLDLLIDPDKPRAEKSCNICGQLYHKSCGIETIYSSICNHCRAYSKRSCA